MRCVEELGISEAQYPQQLLHHLVTYFCQSTITGYSSCCGPRLGQTFQQGKLHLCTVLPCLLLA